MFYCLKTWMYLKRIPKCPSGGHRNDEDYSRLKFQDIEIMKLVQAEMNMEYKTKLHM